MFAIIRMTDKNTILRKSEIKSERINLPSGDAFFTVTTDKHYGKIPWLRLEKCLGILRQDIVTKEIITIPKGINITKFFPDILPRLILINSATDYIIHHKHHFRNKSLTIFDERAIYHNYAEQLLPFFRSIKIITPLPDSYKSISEKLLKVYGFSLVVSDGETKNSEVIIAHSCKVPIYYEGTLFTNENIYLMNSALCTGREIELPDKYERLRPTDIDPMLFASALYEKCGEKELGKLRYKDFGC